MNNIQPDSRLHGRRNAAWRRGSFAILLVGVGVLAGAAIPPLEKAWGEVRGGAPPVAFKSGGQMSVPLLQEIAATLARIDGRLAKIEVVAAQLQTKLGVEQ